MKQITIASAIRDLHGPSGTVKTNDQWELYIPICTEKIYLFQNDYCWQIDKETFNINFKTTNYDIQPDGKWVQSDNHRDKSFWDNQIRNPDYKAEETQCDKDMKTAINRVFDKLESDIDLTGIKDAVKWQEEKVKKQSEYNLQMLPIDEHIRRLKMLFPIPNKITVEF